MEHVLVTGAGGYIGSVLVPILLAEGIKVTALDRFFFGKQTLDSSFDHPNFRLIRCDVRDIDETILDGITAICDMAALSNDPSGDLSPDLTEAVNYRARVRLAGMAKACGVRRYVLASSCSVYGRGNGVLTEDSAVGPLTVYARCNVLAENGLLPLAGPGFAVTVLRNATVFGLSPRMRFDLVINSMTLHAVRKGRILVMGGGRQFRPLVHVTDAARALLAVLRAPAEAVSGQIFNVGKENFTVRSLAYQIRENIPFPIEIEIAPDDADKRDYRVSFDKMISRIGFVPAVTIAEGVREIYEALKTGEIEESARTTTVAWYRSILEAKALVDDVSLGGRLI